MKKRNFLIVKIAGLAALLSGLLALLRSEYEKRSLSVAYYQIRTDKKLRGRRRIAFLTDLHDMRFGKKNKDLLKRIDAYAPDLILIGGDLPLVKKQARLETGLSLCRELSLKYPVYYGNGNHEQRLKNKEKYQNKYAFLTYSLKCLGISHLSDSSAMYEPPLFDPAIKNCKFARNEKRENEKREDERGAGAGIRISGLDIDEEYYKKFSGKKMDPGYIQERLGPSSKDCFEILLAHSPLYLDAYARWGADLVLSGHFHGGTIRLWKEIGLMTPQFQFFNRYVHGLKEKRSTSMIISSGLGTHSIKIRLNNKPELVIVDLIPRKSI